MKSRIAAAGIVFILFGLSCPAFADSDAYQVTFETLDCNGDSGFATVGVDQIYKILIYEAQDFEITVHEMTVEWIMILYSISGFRAIIRPSFVVYYMVFQILIYHFNWQVDNGTKCMMDAVISSWFGSRFVK